MERISPQFHTSYRGKKHTYLFAARTIRLLSCSFLLSFLLLTAEFSVVCGTSTGVSPYYKNVASRSASVHLSSTRGRASNSKFPRVKKLFSHFSKQQTEAKHEALVAEQERPRIRDTLKQEWSVSERGDGESESLSIRRSVNRTSLPENVQTVLVVSQDGAPNHFSTVQAAVDAVPMWNYVNWIIYIMPGNYNGTVVVPEGKNFITFLGENSATTTLSCRRSAKDTPRGIMDSPCVIIEASYFVANNIAFDNTSPKPADEDYAAQTPAIRISGDNSSFYGCSFLGWQDTLFADQGRQYYKDCRVEGSVDYILGYGRALFENCTIYSRSEGFITAQSRWCDNCTSASSAFVFLNCTLTGFGPTYLGRPWRKFAKVLFIDTWMGPHIAPQGWDDWLDGGSPAFTHDNVYFAESNSRGPGANPQARIAWSHQIGEAEVEANSYRDVKTFLDGKDWMRQPPSVETVLQSDLMKAFRPFTRITTINGDQVQYRARRFPKRRGKDLHFKLLG